jgi:protein-L-isoaspartate(D-aspartate) O-methyltransferase
VRGAILKVETQMTTTPTKKLSRARARLLEELSKELSDARVIDAIARVPREEFVPEEARDFAYENRPLPIGYGQTISQPLIVGLMTQALLLQGDETVLEVGTGSGYQAAVLSLLARRVVTVERIAPLAQQAAKRLADLEFTNVEVHVAGEWMGWPGSANYDGIVVTAASPEVPPELLAQLATGGRLVIPVGSRSLQELVRIVKTPQGAQRHNLGPCRFVPLLGSSGWPENPPS